MTEEKLKIFNENGIEIGIANRDEVHKKGYWHETFHCWFVGKEDGMDYIYFQKRSHMKKDFPNLLDITAAGHLLAHETIKDGIREVQEELGINLSMNELVSLGVIKNCIKTQDIVDKEFSHVYLYHSDKVFDNFILQREEVSGIFKTEFSQFYNLCLGKQSEINVRGFEIDIDNRTVLINKNVNLNDFVAHESPFLESVVTLIKNKL